MRRYSLIATVILLAHGLSIGQQTIPERKPIDFPAYRPYLSPNSQYIVGQLIPLGFSADGKFAYVTEPPDEACGCYFFELHIQDLETDIDVYFKRVEYEGSHRQEWSRAWKQYGGQFFAALAKHGIQLTALTAQEFPIAMDSVTLAARITASYRPSPFGTDERFITTTHVLLGNAAWGEKRVARFDYSEEYVKELKPGVFVHSPFENRAALILLRVDRGWEGPPSTVQYVVVGAQLTTRFPKLPKESSQ